VFSCLFCWAPYILLLTYIKILVAITKMYLYNNHKQSIMRIIQADQILQKIPPFLESDLHNKIIISITSDISTKNISYAFKVNNDTVRFQGVRMDYPDYVIIWGDLYNNGWTLLDLIIKECKAIHEANMSVYYLIIESRKDLEDFIAEWKLTDKKFGKELTDYWNKNHETVIQKETLL